MLFALGDTSPYLL